MTDYRQKIVANIFVILLIIVIYLWFRPIEITFHENIIENNIYSNMLSEGEIIWRYTFEGGNFQYDHVIMKYDNQYVYFTTENIHTDRSSQINNATLLQFDNGLCVIPISSTVLFGTNETFAVVSQNEDVEQVRASRYSYSGLRYQNVVEMKRVEGTNVFVGNYGLGTQNNFGYLDNLTIEGYDKNGNLIAINKCRRQVAAERSHERQVSE